MTGDSHRHDYPPKSLSEDLMKTKLQKYQQDYWKNMPRKQRQARYRRNNTQRRNSFVRRVWFLQSRHPGKKVATAQQVADLFEKQQRRCPLTNRCLTPQTAELDHIKSVAAGGSGKIGNLRWVHKDANQAKMKLSDAEFDAVCVDRAKVLGMRF